MVNVGLVALAIACSILAYLADRYSYELCHRGAPIAVLLVATPMIGAVAGIASMFHRAKAVLLVAKLCVTAINAWQVVVALLMLTGVGISDCG